MSKSELPPELRKAARIFEERRAGVHHDPNPTEIVQISPEEAARRQAVSEASKAKAAAGDKGIIASLLRKIKGTKV